MMKKKMKNKRGLSTIVAPESADSSSSAMGIYLDDQSKNVLVSGNTCANNSYGGIYLHNAKNNRIVNNTAFDNKLTQVLFVHSTQYDDSPIRNTTMNNNIFFSKTDKELIIRQSTPHDDADAIAFGTADNNYYARPIEDNFVFLTYINNNIPTYRTLAEWKTYTGQDANSHKSPKTIKPYIINSYLSPNKFYNGNFTINASGVSCWNNAGSCILSWDNTKLDRGALKLSFNSAQSTGNTLIYMRVYNISSNKNYILKYSLISNIDNWKINSYLRKYTDPWTVLSQVHTENINTTRAEEEILFSYPISENEAGIIFSVEQKEGIIWIDNIQLYEVDASLINLDDYMRLEYNPTNANKVVTLPSGNYIDVTGKSYSGSVTLKPYGSIILIKN